MTAYKTNKPTSVYVDVVIFMVEVGNEHMRTTINISIELYIFIQYLFNIHLITFRRISSFPGFQSVPDVEESADGQSEQGETHHRQG